MTVYHCMQNNCLEDNCFEENFDYVLMVFVSILYFKKYFKIRI